MIFMTSIICNPCYVCTVLWQETWNLPEFIAFPPNMCLSSIPWWSTLNLPSDSRRLFECIGWANWIVNVYIRAFYKLGETSVRGRLPIMLFIQPCFLALMCKFIKLLHSCVCLGNGCTVWCTGNAGGNVDFSMLPVSSNLFWPLALYILLTVSVTDVGVKRNVFTRMYRVNFASCLENLCRTNFFFRPISTRDWVPKSHRKSTIGFGIEAKCDAFMSLFKSQVYLQ